MCFDCIIESLQKYDPPCVLIAPSYGYTDICQHLCRYISVMGGTIIVNSEVQVSDRSVRFADTEFQSAMVFQDTVKGPRIGVILTLRRPIFDERRNSVWSLQYKVNEVNHVIYATQTSNEGMYLLTATISGEEPSIIQNAFKRLLDMCGMTPDEIILERYFNLPDEYEEPINGDIEAEFALLEECNKIKN